MAEVYPCATTDLLVHEEFGYTSLVEYEVLGIAYAIRQRLVGYIDGISACFRYVRNPLGECFFGFLFGGRIAGSTFLERILTVLGENFSSDGETGIRSGIPLALPALHFLVSTRTVIVHDDFIPLPVPFAWGKHYGTSIFQHRHQVRYHERLGKHIFGGAIQSRALPTPFASLMDIILPMTLPKDNVLTFEAFFCLVWTGDVLSPWITLVHSFPNAALVLFLAEMIRNQVFNGFPVGIYGHVVIVHRTRQDVFQIAINLLYTFRGERLVAERNGRVDVQFPTLVIQCKRIQFARTEVGAWMLVFIEILV